MFFPFFFFVRFQLFFFFKSFSCVDKDDLGFLFVSSFVLGFGGRAEGNVHILELKKIKTPRHFKKNQHKIKKEKDERKLFLR